jgi:undecaprenyl-diphosphatase
MKKTHFCLLWFSLCVFGVFVLLSFLVRMNFLVSFDWRVTTVLQRLLSTNWDGFFSFFSVLGSFDVSCVFVLCLAGYLYFHRKQFGALFSLVAFGLILGFELYGKIFIRHPSPPVRFARYMHFLALPTDILPHPSYSFPSGHSSRTLFLSTVVLLLLFGEKRVSKTKQFLISFGVVIYDVIMLVSRVDLGEHWASDVMGGVLLGIALGSLTVWGIIRFQTCLPAGKISDFRGKTSEVRRKSNRK